MKKIDIILSGVGGQGILSIATVIGAAALHSNLQLKQSEVHGMSQRGGDVQANLRLSSEPIASDLIPLVSADVIISLEPMEALRYLPFLAPNGYVVTSVTPFVNIENYPQLEILLAELGALPNSVLIDVEKLASDLGNTKAANMVLLGAASHFIDLDWETLKLGVSDIFGRKGEQIVEANIKAMECGRNAVKI